MPDTQVSFAQALALLEKNRDREAAVQFWEVLQLDQGNAEVWYYLGITQLRLGNYAPAEQCLRQALALNPQLQQAWFWLGNVLTYQGQEHAAVATYRTLVDLAPTRVDAWNALGKTLSALGNFTEAEQSLRQALKLAPGHTDAHNQLGQLLYAQGDYEQAQDCYRQTLVLDRGNLKAAIGLCLSLPIIYRDRGHMLAARRAFDAGLDRLTGALPVYKQRKTLFSDMDWNSAFYLAYQGFDDKNAVVRLGTFFRELAACVLPQFMTPVKPRPVSSRRLRIGYVSRYFHAHTVAYYFNGWIQQADREHFETFVYHINPRTDLSPLAAACDHYVALSGLIPDLARRIEGDELDILIYPEIGMYPKHAWLAALRLAPVQCAAFGHPLTTGLASIDYYLSADASEPDVAEQHYSETLIRLPGIGVYCEPPPAPPAAERQDFNLPAERTLYLCPQALFKIHVDMDALFVGIAARDPRALILLFESPKPLITDALRQRLERVFQASGLQLDAHLRFLPRLNHQDYLRLNSVCDIMIDTPHFGGGRTALDALSCGLPIVTLPGRYSRGRQAYGMLRILGLTELIATDEDDYIARAVDIATTRERREYFAQEIKRRAAGTLFNNAASVRALEDFYQHSVRQNVE